MMNVKKVSSVVFFVFATSFWQNSFSAELPSLPSSADLNKSVKNLISIEETAKKRTALYQEVSNKATTAVTDASAARMAAEKLLNAVVEVEGEAEDSNNLESKQDKAIALFKVANEKSSASTKSNNDVIVTLEGIKPECEKSIDGHYSAIKAYINKNVDEASYLKTSAYIDTCLSSAKASSSDKLVEFSQSLTKLVNVANANINSLKEQEFGAATAELTDIRAKVSYLQKIRSDLNVVITTLSVDESKTVTWKDDFIYNFYLGAEGVSAGDIKDKATVRTGFMVYNQLSGALNRQSNLNCINNNWANISEKEKCGLFDVHLFMRLLLTNSGETTEQANDSTSADVNTIADDDKEIKKALELDVNVYLPYRWIEQSRGLLAFGPVFSLGIIKNDVSDNDAQASGESDFIRRSYIGFRLAHSQESYFDLMYGKTSGIGGNRLDIRAQLPLTDVSDNILIGLRANLSIKDRDKAPNTDTVSFYITYRVSIDKLI